MSKAIWSVLIACCLTFAATLGSSPQSVSIPVIFQDATGGYLGLQAPNLGSALTQENRGNEMVWSNELFEIHITQHLSEGQKFVKAHVVSQSGSPLGIYSVSFRVLAPAISIDGVWTPSGHIADDRLISADPGTEFVTYSAANFGIPYIAAATSTGKNILALGLLEQDLTVQLHTAPAKDGVYAFEVNANVPPNRTVMDHEFFMSDDSSCDWFDTARKYADWVDARTNYRQFPISDRAYTPVYDTWYWSKDAVDDHLYLGTGQMASEAGLGTFLADSGWDTTTGEYNKWLLGSTGDYTPPTSKFPNLPATFDALRSAFNLKISLWLQPFAVGRTSVRYADTQALHIQIPKTSNSNSLAPYDLPEGSNTLEDVNLCPQLTATHRYLKDLFGQMASTYHPEGYWLDFLDGMPAVCVAPHHHDFDTFGGGLRAALTAIRDAILENDVNPVVQFRAQYANLNNKSFANVWQPFDSPSDFDRMRLDALRLRPFSNGVVFASDELYWPDSLNDAGVARFVMTDVMTGIPSIGANLLKLRPSAVEIVKGWMNFYRTYQSDLTTGRFHPLGSFRVPNHSIESESRIFVYIRSRDNVSLSVSSRKQLFLMNASDHGQINSSISVSDAAHYQVQIYNHFLQPQGAPTETTSNSGGVLDVHSVVPRGGMVVLTPVDLDPRDAGLRDNLK